MQLILWIYFFMVSIVNGANILGIFSNPKTSSLLLGQALFGKLSQQGHNVTMISSKSLDIQLENYHNIELKALALIYQHFLRGKGKLTRINEMWDELMTGLLLTERVFYDLSLNRFFKNQNQFDLIIIENYMNEAHLVLGHHFEAPIIGFSASGISDITLDTTGNSRPIDMNDCIIGRLRNYFSHIIFRVMQQLYFYKKHNELIQKYFPKAPLLKALMRNVSLTLYNSHPSFEYPNALMPNSIEIGGFHIKNETKLPAEIQELMDSANDGVIYFSLGMDVKSKDIHPNLKQILVDAFGKLRQTVLWRCEEKFIPGQTKNLHLKQWWPQNDILAHPSMKLFITHGGGSSFSEAIYHGVPILIIPILNEHFENVRRVKTFELGLSIKIENFTEQAFLQAIDHILTTPKYRDNVKKRSDLLKNQIISPDDKAMFWIEYVIKNRGATILRPPTLDFPWYRVWMWDILSLIVLFGIVSIYSFVVVKKLIHYQLARYMLDSKNVNEDNDKKNE